MKILIATGLYPPEIGGPATYTALLEKELPDHGHRVVVVPFRVSRNLPRGIRHIHYLFVVMLKARGVRVIFAQDVLSVGFPALVAARVLGKKFFVRVPGDYAWEQATQRFGVTDSIDDFQNKTYDIRTNIIRSLQKFVTKNADQVITPSDYFRKLVTNWGVEPKKVCTIYNGVDLNVVPASGIIKPASLTIVSAGRLVPWKGFQVLIEVMRDLPSWHLVILGGGPQSAVLEELINKNHLKDRVHLLGTVSRDEVFGWCKAADVFVLNTHFESFSYQIVEAMYAGVPIVTTNVGSLPELIASGEEGLLLSPDDKVGMVEAIKSVVTEKALWQRRSINAIRKAQHFSIDATVEKLCQSLKKYEK